MNIFNLFSKGKKKSIFPISKEERQWIEDDFLWMIDRFGYPTLECGQVIFTKDYFPNTFSKQSIEIQDLIDDLCELLGIDPEKITFQTFEEIHDIPGLPMGYDGKFLFSETKIENDKYIIYINKKNLKIPNRLIYGLVCEFIKIRFLEYDSSLEINENSDLLIFIGGLYFGFGVLLAQFMTDVGYSTDGEWETKWMTVSPFSHEELGFTIGLYSKLINEDTLDWENELTRDLKKLVEKAKEFLTENPSRIIDENEVELRILEKKGDE